MAWGRWRFTAEARNAFINREAAAAAAMVSFVPRTILFSVFFVTVRAGVCELPALSTTGEHPMPLPGLADLISLARNTMPFIGVGEKMIGEYLGELPSLRSASHAIYTSSDQCGLPASPLPPIDLPAIDMPPHWSTRSTVLCGQKKGQDHSGQTAPSPNNPNRGAGGDCE